MNRPVIVPFGIMNQKINQEPTPLTVSGYNFLGFLENMILSFYVCIKKKLKYNTITVYLTF